MFRNPTIGEGVLDPNEPVETLQLLNVETRGKSYSIACKVPIDWFLPTPDWNCIDRQTIQAVYEMYQRSLDWKRSR